MAYPPVIPPNNRTDATDMVTVHASDHNALATALANMPWGVVAAPVVLSGAQQTIPASAITDITGATITWTRRADRRYIARYSIQVQQASSAAVFNVYIKDAAGNNITFRGWTGTAGQYLGLVDFIDVSGAAGAATVKLAANTPSGSLIIANSTSPGILTVEDVGPKP